MANRKITELPVGSSTTTTATKFEAIQGGINVQLTEDDLPGQTREFNRAFVETLVFNKNEIFHTPIVMTDNIILEIGAGGLVDQASSMRFRITTDGIHSISFGPGFDFLYGISNGQILDVGTYEVYLLYTNGSVSVNVPGVTAESSAGVTLSTPSNFAAVADGENAIDLSWTDVSNESSYLIEFSLTGTGGWSTLSTPAANATTSTQTGLAAGDIRYYRIRAIGDGVNFLDSAWSTVVSGQTESGGDVTAPTFTFDPVNGNNTWSVNWPLTITANEPLRNTNGTEITNANVAALITVKQTNSSGANIAFTATIDSTKQIITVRAATHWGENQLVYLAINNVEDVNGNEVTVAQSITFTTTDYTRFSGTSSYLYFGDILDSLWTPNDTNFWLEITIKNFESAGQRPLITKYSTLDVQRAFQLYHTGNDVYFGYVKNRFGAGNRVIKWTGALSGSEHTLVLKYDGSIDTNDGLDRVTLLVDGLTAGSKTLETNNGETISTITIPNVTSQLAVGTFVTANTTPGTVYFGGEAKDFIVRSSNGSVVQLNVPNFKLGTDTSGNGLHGTWP